MQLVTIPSEILNEKCHEVAPVEMPELESLVEEMIDIMIASNGMGLAAPQVGIRKRIIVFLGQTEEGDLGEPVVMINPEITKLSSDSTIAIEGCLSVPVFKIPVERSSHVCVSAFGIDGIRYDYQADDVVARCIQHEIDHLNGITLLDHLDDDCQPKFVAIPKPSVGIEESDDDDFPYICLEVSGKEQVIKLYEEVFDEIATANCSKKPYETTE